MSQKDRRFVGVALTWIALTWIALTWVALTWVALTWVELIIMNNGSGELSAGDDGSPKRGSPVLISIAVISLGAALGALLRWYFAVRFNQIFPHLPPGTLAANLLGGYLIGIAMAVFLTFPALSPQWRLLTVTGFLGGLTTFSTFSAEVTTALLEGQGLWALSTIAAHVIGSVVMTLLGVGTVRGLRLIF